MTIRWTLKKMLKSFGCSWFPFSGCEGRPPAGSGADKAAKKKQNRLQTLHVWPLRRQEPSPTRRRRWWCWGHQRTIDGGVIIAQNNLTMKTICLIDSVYGYVSLLAKLSVWPIDIPQEVPNFWMAAIKGLNAGRVLFECLEVCKLLMTIIPNTHI